MQKKSRLFVESRLIMGHRVDYDLGILPDIYQQLSDYLHIPIEQISNDYWQGRETGDKQQQSLIEATASGEEVLEYYRTTAQYLYELMLWEAQKDKQAEFKKLYLFCKKLSVQKVLDFGGGVGGLSIFLNRHGLNCDYLDVPGQTYDFARWRFNRQRLSLKIISATQEKLLSGYDAVIAYDVFEHIFNLPETISRVNSYLKINGYLISKSSFSGGGLHLLKNESYQNFHNFNNLLLENGFQFLGRLKVDRLSNLLHKLGCKYRLFSIRLSKRPKHGGNLMVHKKIKLSPLLIKQAV